VSPVFHREHHVCCVDAERFLAFVLWLEAPPGKSLGTRRLRLSLITEPWHLLSFFRWMTRFPLSAFLARRLS